MTARSSVLDQPPTTGSPPAFRHPDRFPGSPVINHFPRSAKPQSLRVWGDRSALAFYSAAARGSLATALAELPILFTEGGCTDDTDRLALIVPCHRGRDLRPSSESEPPCSRERTCRMRRTDGQPREIDPIFGHSFGVPHGAPGHELEPQRADGLGGDLADGETLAWETAWVDLGGEG